MVISPFTEKTAEERRRDRETAIELAGIQIARLADHFDKRHEVSRSIFRRIVQSLLKIGGHLPMAHDHAEALQAKLNAAGMKDQWTLHIEGDSIYIEGYFNLKALQKEVLW